MSTIVDPAATARKIVHFIDSSRAESLNHPEGSRDRDIWEAVAHGAHAALTIMVVDLTTAATGPGTGEPVH